ncbi:MAG: NlpC/P60 family protein, partial [Chloroflexota bacterium]|nr:NlpC/P60 family protein [Chloroflexota bacterium]
TIPPVTGAGPDAGSGTGPVVPAVTAPAAAAPGPGFGPDDPSLFGWPASVGGIPLAFLPGSAAWTTTTTVVSRLDAGRDDLAGPVIGVDGTVWDIDGGFVGESAPTRPRDPALDIVGTDDDALFLTQRRSRLDADAFGYQLSVPGPGVYRVRLHLAELWWGAPGGGPGAAGQRVFDVWAEGVPVLVAVDIFAIAGAMTATSFEVDVAVADQALDLWFAASADVPSVAAIEVLVPGSGAGAAMVAVARQSLGAPYVWATSGPNSFDCSGFTNWVVSNVLGVSIGLNQLHQIAYGSAVGQDVLRPGDLVFFQGTHPYLAGVSHVGIYVGDGQFIHASAGAGAVVVSDLTWGYYASHYYGAVRLV